MTDRIAEIEERLSEKSCECQAYGICLPEWASDVSDLLAEVKSKDAEIARLRGLLREVYEDGWYAEAIEYPCDYCDEMKDLARRVMAELEGR